jgi:hypothetical protein
MRERTLSRLRARSPRRRRVVPTGARRPSHAGAPSGWTCRAGRRLLPRPRVAKNPRLLRVENLEGERRQRTCRRACSVFRWETPKAPFPGPSCTPRVGLRRPASRRVFGGGVAPAYAPHGHGRARSAGSGVFLPACALVELALLPPVKPLYSARSPTRRPTSPCAGCRCSSTSARRSRNGPNSPTR